MIRNKIEFEQYDVLDRIKTTVRISGDRLNDVNHLCSVMNTNKEKLFDNMIYVYTYHRVCVVSIKCKITKKVYVDLFGIEKILHRNFNLNVFSQCEPMIRNDLLQYGVGEFEVEVLGIFRSSSEALNYRDFLINRYLDLGYDYYGYDLANGIIPRFLCIRLDLEIVDKLFNYCRKKGISVNNLLSKLIGKLFNR